MKKSRLLTHTVAVFAVLSVSALAQARECGGYNTHSLISVEVNEIAKGHTLMTVRNQDMIVANSTSDIYHLTMGECSGTVLTTPDGKSSGSGFCIRKDKDGDTHSIDWAIAPGAEKGTWKSTGGTGKFADLKAQGWWAYSVNDGGKLGINVWGGTCSK